MNRTRHLLLLVTAILLAAALRLPQIYGDPPGGDLSRSGAFLTDEGSYGYNAVMWVLTGDWHVPDALNPGVNTPIFMVYEFALLKVFGQDLAAVRYGSVACGLVTLLLLFIIVRNSDRKAALITVFLGAITFPLIVYNRLALLENLLLCAIMAAAMVLWRLVNNPNGLRYVVLFWLLVCVGYLIKPSALFLVLLFLPLTLQIQKQARNRIYGVSIFAIALFGALVWIFWISRYYQDWHAFQQLNIGTRLSFNPIAIFRNYARHTVHLKLFEFIPGLYSIALFMVLRAIYDLIRKRDMHRMTLFFVLWFLAGWLMIGFFSYSPPRYALILLPAILALNGLFFSNILHRDKSTGTDSRIIFIVLTIIAVLQISFGIYRIVEYNQTYPSCFLPAMALLFVFIFWAAPKKAWPDRKVGLTLLSFIIAVQLFQIARFHLTMEHSLHSAIQDTARILAQHPDKGEQVVLAGDLAPLAAFEARVPAIDIAYRHDTLPRLVKRWQPNYLLLEDPQELLRLQQQMPDYWRSVTRLQTYRIMNNYKHGQDAVLYRVE